MIDANNGAQPQRLRFLGTAGFDLSDAAGKRWILDPYLSRPGLVTSVSSRLRPRADLLAREITEADYVLCGHSHYDHALDAPIVAAQNEALLVGSKSTMNLGRAAGLPEALMYEVAPDNELPNHAPAANIGGIVGSDAYAAALPSQHGKAIFGRVPIPGEITSPPQWPPRMWEMKHGPVYLWYLDLGDATILHVDTADYFPETLADVQVDILLLCAIGRKYRPGYTEKIIDLVQPRVVVPCHWDNFARPWHKPAKPIPGVDLPGFRAEIAATGTECVLLGLGDRWSW